MKVILGDSLKSDSNLRTDKEREVRSYDDVLAYLMDGKNHGEYVWVRYFDSLGHQVSRYTVRCWYNDDAECLLKREDGVLGYDWKLSQIKNAQELWGYIEQDRALA